MSALELVTTGLSVAVPLLVLAYTFGRLSEKADGLKEAVEEGFNRLGQKEDEQDKTLIDHHGRLVSLEEFRRLQEGRNGG